MLRRLLALLLIVWAMGFVGFAAFQPQPAPLAKSDGIIVLTGGEGRITRGLDLLRSGAAPRMLISGVDPEVKPGELAAEYKIGGGLAGLLHHAGIRFGRYAQQCPRIRPMDRAQSPASRAFGHIGLAHAPRCVGIAPDHSRRC